METTAVFKRILAATGDASSGVLTAAGQMKALEACAEVDTFHVDGRQTGLLDELLNHAADTRADLLLMGGKTHALASRAAMLAPCPVLMVPDGMALSFDKILVPVDFSDSSAEAARCAIRLADKTGGDWRAVAVECTDELWLDWKDEPDKMLNQLQSFIEAATGRSPVGRCMVEPLNRSVIAVDHTGFSPAHRIEGADIASTIAQVAKREKASLMVVGTRGRSSAALILLGSVTEHLMQLVSCPVLAVKQPGHLSLLGAIREKLRNPEAALAAN